MLNRIRIYDIFFQCTLTIKILLLSLTLFSCSSSYFPSVKERKSKRISYVKAGTNHRSKIRTGTHPDSLVTYDRIGNVTKEIAYGKVTGGTIFKKGRIARSWSGRDFNQIDKAKYYYYEDDELKKTETWEFRKNKKYWLSDSTYYRNGKAIRPNTEVIKEGDWEISKGQYYVDSIKLDSKNRPIIKKRYSKDKGRLTSYSLYEYHRRTTITNYYEINYDSSTDHSMTITYIRDRYSAKGQQTLWKLEFNSRLSFPIRIVYEYNKHGFISKKLYFENRFDEEELKFCVKYRYKYY